MELDEMKAAWAEMNERLEQLSTLNLKVFRDGRLREARHALRPLQTGQVVQIVAGVVLMFSFAPVWVAHWGTLHLMLPGLLMHAYGLLFVVCAARTLYLISRADCAAPVLQVQSALAELRLWRARVEQPMFAIAGCFIWIPLLLAGFNALGVDLWAERPAIVGWDIASGFVCLAALYGGVRWVRRSGSERARAALENSIVGRSIGKAQAEFEEIVRFEKE